MPMRTLLSLLLATLFVLPPVLAEDDDADDDRKEREGKDDARDERDEDDEERFDRVKRKMRFEVDGDQVQIKLAREGGGSEDEVKIHYVAHAGTMKVEYEAENATSEIESSLKVRVREVLEVRDANGDAAFDPNDTVVARHPIGRLDWTLTGPEDITTGGTPGKRITGVGAFPEGGSLVFVLHAFGDFATINGTSLLPTEVKIDILLDHFPYRANDTQVALLVASEQETEVEAEATDAGLVASAAGFAASFTWAEHALVDGVLLPVRTTLLRSEADDDGAQASFALTYPRGTLINHDPIVGIQGADADARSVPAPAVYAMVLAVAAVAAVTGARGSGRGRA